MAGAGLFGYRLGPGEFGKEEIVGLRELQADLRKLGDDAKNDMKPAHKAAAEVVVAGSKKYVPYQTGALANSIRAIGLQRSGVVRAGSASVPYAGPIHFGWPARAIRPQPFIYEALDDRRADVLNIYEKRMGELIKKYDLQPGRIAGAFTEAASGI